MTWVLLTSTVAVLVAIAVACRRAEREARHRRDHRLRLVTTGEGPVGNAPPPAATELPSAS